MVFDTDLLRNCDISAEKENWQFDCKVPCPTFIDVAKQYQHSRYLPNKTQLLDMKDFKFIGMNITNTTILSVGCFRQNITIVKRFLNQKCSDEKAVPNIVHYVWLGGLKEMEFYQFLSVFSAYKFLKPCMILFHGESLPYGKYWKLLLSLVSNIIHICRESPTEIEGIKIKHIEHKADIVRFQVLQEFGGIYLDTDSVVLKSLDPLRVYNFTLSTENPGVLGIATMLSLPNAKFLNIWLEHYITFNPENWGLHSVILPYRLWKKYPYLIHVENKTFYISGSGEQLYKQNIHWSHMYAMHMSMRYNKYMFNEVVIRHLNTTLGAMARYILFNSKELCS